MQPIGMTTIQCPCCGSVMFCLMGQEADLGMRVTFKLQLFFDECPQCGEDMKDVMIFSPKLQGQAQVKPRGGKGGQLIRP